MVVHPHLPKRGLPPRHNKRKHKRQNDRPGESKLFCGPSRNDKHGLRPSADPPQARPRRMQPRRSRLRRTWVRGGPVPGRDPRAGRRQDTDAGLRWSRASPSVFGCVAARRRGERSASSCFHLNKKTGCLVRVKRRARSYDAPLKDAKGDRESAADVNRMIWHTWRKQHRRDLAHQRTDARIRRFVLDRGDSWVQRPEGWWRIQPVGRRWDGAVLRCVAHKHRA